MERKSGRFVLAWKAARATMLCVGLALPAAAQEEAELHRGFSLGGRGAYLDPRDGDANWFGGAQARFHFTRVFAVEGSIDYRQEEFNNTETDIFPVQASFLIYPLPFLRITPFALVGGGWYYTHVEGPGGFRDNSRRFGLHGGGGLQMFLNRSWSVDGTYRYLFTEDIESRDPTGVLDQEYRDDGHMVTIGLNYHF